jgi:hypothetical protein
MAGMWQKRLLTLWWLRIERERKRKGQDSNISFKGMFPMT